MMVSLCLRGRQPTDARLSLCVRIPDERRRLEGSPLGRARWARPIPGR